MEYREATDALTRCITLEDLARHLGISEQAVKQARLSPDASGHRPPPPGWRLAVAILARQHGETLQALADQLEAD